MFYAHFVLAKKGPLARIWLAAHWDKKLTKAHVFETNIEKSVDGILQPKVKMALRTSGHLLLGVVRIYSRKAKYLLADCNEAFVKIKMAFRPGMVDLPEDTREAAVSAITLPQVFHDFDTPMPELNDVDIQAQFTLNQSRAEEITMREDYGTISLIPGDDGFGDMGFDEDPPELRRENTSIDQSLGESHLMFSENIVKNKVDKEEDSRIHQSSLDMEAPIRDDGFGGNLDHDLIDTGGLFGGGIFDDTPMDEGPPVDSALPEKIEKELDDSDDDGVDMDRFGGPSSVGAPSTEPGSPSASPRNELLTQKPEEEDLPPTSESLLAENQDAAGAQDQTTLLHNEEESFALAPVDSSAIKSGWPRTKRKRKLIVDEVKNISGEEMKAQLSDTTDIVTTLDLAPPSRRLMHWKETGGVEKLFALPGRSINAHILGKLYQRNLTSKHCINEDFGMAGDKEIENLRLEQVYEDESEPMIVPRPRGRPPKRKFHEMENNQEERVTRSSIQAAANNQPSFDDLLSPAPAPTVEPIHLDEASFSSPPQLPPVQDTSVPPAPATNEEIVAPQPEEAPAPEDHHDNDSFTSPRPAELETSLTHDDILSPEPHIETQPEILPIVEEEEEEAAPPPPTVDLAFSPPPELPHSPVKPEEEEQEPEPEEQAEDETYEEYEERIVNKRAGLVFHQMKGKLKQGEVHFSALNIQANRKQVAQKFYSLLVLKKLQAVELKQEGAYAEIIISKGATFANPAL